MQTPAPASLRKTPEPPQLITCRPCGTKHRAIVCPICKVPTPSFVVIRGRR